MKIPLKITVLIFTFALQACSSYGYKREVLKIDPAYNRLVIFNSSQYRFQEDGILNRSIDPGETVQLNIPCYGRFEGIMTAYRNIGTKNGKVVWKYYGQRRYSVRIDGKNYVYNRNNNLSADFYREFRQSEFYPSRRGREHFVAPRRSLCELNSSVRIFFGR